MGLVTVGCSSELSGTSEKDGKIKVTSTIGMIGDVANNIGGEHIDSVSLMKPGVDPHLYKATQGDIGKLEEADIIFYNGLHLEGQMIDIFEKMKKDKPTIAVTKKVPEESLLAGDGEITEHDPHLWFNVQYWIQSAEVIRDELISLDGENEEDYRENAEKYIAELEELDAYAKEQINTIPEKDRVLVTAHDAFGYFGDAYGLKVIGLQGISTQSEVGSKDVSELRDYLVKNKIKAVFVESSVPKNTIEAVIEGAKGKGHEVKIGGELFSDAMGDESTEEGTYQGMVRHNVDTIVESLK
ncbi:MAG: metal ABC transporter solute-binding protein, Zn/Mn family [Bacillus sp. (in: firmicutes)]